MHCLHVTRFVRALQDVWVVRMSQRGGIKSESLQWFVCNPCSSACFYIGIYRMLQLSSVLKLYCEKTTMVASRFFLACFTFCLVHEYTKFLRNAFKNVQNVLHSIPQVSFSCEKSIESILNLIFFLNSIDIFCSPILFSICTSAFSKLCKRLIRTMACRRVLTSTPCN
jgi:hypothetical protein